MTPFSFELIAGGSGTFDVIFIHGLSGDPKETWTSPVAVDPSNAYWPAWVSHDVSVANVYALGYPADAFASWLVESMSLYERAKAVLEHLAGLGLGSRPIAIVAHSLGGLLAKQILRTGLEADDEDWLGVASSIKLVLFLSTPHSGSSVASALTFVMPKLASKYSVALQAGSALLDELNASYKSAAQKQQIQTVAYYETFRTKAVLVVSKESANPGVSGVNPIPIDADHSSICKPVNRESPIYISVLRKLRKFAESCPAAASTPSIGNDKPFVFDSADYLEKTRDRRDLLAKLEAANREHEYRFANEAQNKFAQSYMRLGLHAAAKEANDSLLNDIQQRFETHIYLPLICKGASDAEIQGALQITLIDPIVEKYAASHKVQARTVIEGMYFLTEQCHIRWDPA